MLYFNRLLGVIMLAVSALFWLLTISWVGLYVCVFGIFLLYSLALITYFKTLYVVGLFNSIEKITFQCFWSM